VSVICRISIESLGIIGPHTLSIRRPAIGSIEIIRRAGFCIYFLVDDEDIAVHVDGVLIAAAGLYNRAAFAEIAWAYRDFRHRYSTHS